MTKKKILEVSRADFNIIKEYMDNSQKLKAVKTIKDILGLGLREAKNIADNFWQYIPMEHCECPEKGHTKFNGKAEIVCAKCELVRE